jgi:hypothetical protein
MKDSPTKQLQKLTEALIFCAEASLLQMKRSVENVDNMEPVEEADAQSLRIMITAHLAQRATARTRKNAF